jgi:hypothetical protein
VASVEGVELSVRLCPEPTEAVVLLPGSIGLAGSMVVGSGGGVASSDIKVRAPSTVYVRTRRRMPNVERREERLSEHL